MELKSRLSRIAICINATAWIVNKMHLLRAQAKPQHPERSEGAKPVILPFLASVKVLGG